MSEVDFDGNAIIGNPDIGAFEFQGPFGTVVVTRLTALYPGQAKLNVTPISNPTDTTLTSDHTYSLADSHQIRNALGWTWGVDHWAFTDVGVPKVITGATILANGNGPNIWANANQVTILA